MSINNMSSRTIFLTIAILISLSFVYADEFGIGNVDTNGYGYGADASTSATITVSLNSSIGDTIGNSVSNNTVLFIDGIGQLAQSPFFKYQNGQLNLTSIAGSSPLSITGNVTGVNNLCLKDGTNCVSSGNISGGGTANQLAYFNSNNTIKSIPNTDFISPWTYITYLISRGTDNIIGFEDGRLRLQDLIDSQNIGYIYTDGTGNISIEPYTDGFGYYPNINLLQNVYVSKNVSARCYTFMDGTTQCSASSGTGSTFNSTYQTWGYNQTTPAIAYANSQGWNSTYNASYLTSTVYTNLAWINQSQIFTGFNNFTKAISITNGTNTAPALSFISDSDTGIYQGTGEEGVIKFTGNGTNYLKFNSNGGEPTIQSTQGIGIGLYANGGQNIFRGLDGWTGTWTDSVPTSFFQVGRSTGNVEYSCFLGTICNRIAYASQSFQYSNFFDSGDLLKVPTHYVEWFNGNTTIMMYFNLTGELWVNKSVSTPSLYSTNMLVGNSTGNTTMANDGTITLRGTATVFDDISAPLTVAHLGVTAPTFDENQKAYAFADGVSEQYAMVSVQLPHSYKEGSNIGCHLHVRPDGTQKNNVTFEMNYTWFNIWESSAGSTSLTVSQNFTSGVAYNSTIIDFPAITGTGKKMSSIVLAKITRKSNVASDSYTGSVYADFFDCHVEKDSLGSNLGYIK